MANWQNINYFGNQQNNNNFGRTAKDLFGVGKDIYGAFNGGGGYGDLIFGGLNAGKTALQGGSWNEDIPQSFFGIDDEKDSDFMQGLKGAGKGAMMGTAIFPGIGTAIGAALGLGASFLDDI